MTIKKFREFLSEDWLVVDKEKNCVISKHGDDEKAATIAGRKMDFINYNKTKKLGRFAILATHGKDMVMDKPDQFAQVGDKKKAAAKAKKATSKAKPAAKKAPAKKATTTKKPAVKTPGQSKGGLGTQIGGLIAKHMAKMFKEDVSFYTAKQNIPVVNKADILKRAQERRQKAAQDYQKKFSNAKNYSDISGPTGSSEYQHAQNVIKTSKKQALIQKAYNIEHPPKGDDDYNKAKETLGNARKSATKKAAWAINHPYKAAALAGATYMGYKALGVAKKTLFNSVNDQIERLLFETEETPNYYVQVLMSKGGIGDKSFRRHTIATMAPRFSGAPNEVFPEGFIPNLLFNDPKFLELKEEGYSTS